MEKYAEFALRILPIRRIRSTIFGIFMPDKPITEWEAFAGGKHLDPRYHDWTQVRNICAHIAIDVIHAML